MNASRIDAYTAGGSQLLQSIWGLPHDQLHAQPPDGSWTIHQIVTHMLDSDLIASDRMKRIACMDLPLLVGYDETAFSNLPGRSELNAFAVCELFQKNRQLTAIILSHLPESAWSRAGIHTESGKVTLAEMLEKYIWHLEHHLAFIHRKRDWVLGLSSNSKATGATAPAVTS
jgi:uncharacterized damage-inducible protein DinB